MGGKRTNRCPRNSSYLRTQQLRDVLNGERHQHKRQLLAVQRELRQTRRQAARQEEVYRHRLISLEYGHQCTRWPTAWTPNEREQTYLPPYPSYHRQPLVSQAHQSVHAAGHQANAPDDRKVFGHITN